MLVAVQWYHITVSICIVLIANGFVTFKGILIQLSGPFLAGAGGWVQLFLIDLKVLYAYSEYKSSSDICIAKICSHFVVCLFRPLIDEHKFLILMV